MTTTTVASARTLLVTEGYAREDVVAAIDSLISEGLDTPAVEQGVDDRELLRLEEWELQCVREAIVSERGVSIGDIAVALRAAGIDYRVEHPGTVHVGALALAPSRLDQDGNGLGIDSYDGGASDWHETVEGAVDRATKYAR
jgi:hypothetical protein